MKSPDLEVFPEPDRYSRVPKQCISNPLYQNETIYLFTFGHEALYMLNDKK